MGLNFVGCKDSTKNYQPPNPNPYVFLDLNLMKMDGEWLECALCI